MAKAINIALAVLYLIKLNRDADKRGFATAVKSAFTRVYPRPTLKSYQTHNHFDR